MVSGHNVNIHQSGVFCEQNAFSCISTNSMRSKVKEEGGRNVYCGSGGAANASSTMADAQMLCASTHNVKN